jgi:hypothetical protein
VAIRICQAAVSDADSEVTLYLSRESWGHTVIAGQKHCPGETLRVRSYSLANILEETKTEFVGQELILKIDAEGVEGPLLLNTPADCFASVKEVMFEYHSFAGCDLRVILDRLQSLGFEYTASVKDVDLHRFRANSRPDIRPLWIESRASF